jgi:DNA-binding MarR family transcriptional regulator
LRRFVRFSEEQAREHGITPQQYLLLLAVRGHPDYPLVSIGTVAESLQIRHHSTSLLVDRSVRRGLLLRREDPRDRRRALVSLTKDGQEVLDRVMDANRRQMVELRGDLFRDSLQQALASLGAAVDAD